MKKLACPSCLSIGLAYDLLPQCQQGFASKAKISCLSCSEEIDEEFTCKRVRGSQSNRALFDVNMRAMMAFKGIGCGFADMIEWSGTINMPSHLQQNAYANNHSSCNL